MAAPGGRTLPRNRVRILLRARFRLQFIWSSVYIPIRLRVRALQQRRDLQLKPLSRCHQPISSCGWPLNRVQ